MSYLEIKRKALLGSGEWYLTAGLTSEAVIAAYQFKSRVSQTEALNTLCGWNSYTLSLVSGGYTNPGVPTWSSDGVSIKGGARGYSGLLSSSLNNQRSNHTSVFVKYSNLQSSGSAGQGPFALMYTDGTYQKMLMALGLGYNFNPPTDGSVKAGPTLRYGSKAYYGSTRTYMKYQTGKPFLSSAVIGFVNNVLYVNGEAVQTTTDEVYHISRMDIGGETYNINYDEGLVVTFGNGIITAHGTTDAYYQAQSRSYTLEAAVIYNQSLDAAQAASISAAMLRL